MNPSPFPIKSLTTAILVLLSSATLGQESKLVFEEVIVPQKNVAKVCKIYPKQLLCLVDKILITAKLPLL